MSRSAAEGRFGLRSGLGHYAKAFFCSEAKKECGVDRVAGVIGWIGTRGAEARRCALPEPHSRLRSRRAWSAAVGREGLTQPFSRLSWVYAWLLLRDWCCASIGQGGEPPSLPSVYGGKGMFLSKFFLDSHNPVPTIPPFFSFV